MTQQEAAKILQDNFYEWHKTKHGGPYSREWFRRDNGQLCLPNRVDPSELQKRRDELLGKDFKFTWPKLPTGAHYIED